MENVLKKKHLSSTINASSGRPDPASSGADLESSNEQQN